MRKRMYKFLFMAILIIATTSAIASAETGDVAEWLEEQGHRMIDISRPNRNCREFAELVGNKMTYYPQQDVTFFEMLAVTEVPDKDIMPNMGAKYSVYIWQFKKYDDGRIRSRWETSEGLDKEFKRVRFAESKLPNDGWHDVSKDNPLVVAGFQYLEEYDGVMGTGEYLQTKDEFDRTR